LIVKSKIKKISFVFDREILIQIFKSTYPYALLAFIMMAYTRIDSILLRQLLPDGDYQNGIYSQGYRLLDAGNMMIALIAVILLPLFSRLLQQKENVSNLIDLCLGLMIVPSLIICCICLVFRVEVMNLLYHHSTDLSVNVFAITMLSFISFSFMYVFGTLLTANGSLSLLNKLAFIALIMNVFLNLILIPIYKSLGAAYAALITQGFIAISNTFCAYKLNELQFNRNLFVRILLYTISILIISLLLKYYIFNWVLALVVSLSLATLLLFTFKIFNLKMSLELFKNKLNT
jgi:O-antigen/teichoic acid export membrane protein